MSKTESKETLVDRVFKANTKAEKVFTTSDGQPFVVEHHAKMHAKSLKDQAIKTHTRKKAKAAPKKVAPKNPPSSNVDTNGNGKFEAKELIEAIEKAESVEAVDALVPKDEKRVTVLNAAKERKEALSEGGE